MPSVTSPWKSHALPRSINKLAVIQCGTEHDKERIQGGEGHGAILEFCYLNRLCEVSPSREESECFHLAIPQRGVWEGRKEKVKPMGTAHELHVSC